MTRKPKVYRAEIDGLHDWIVAAANQADALAALGVHQNLFQQGLAGPTDEPGAVAAAQAAPGVPLRRLKGSKDAFRPAEDGVTQAWTKAAKAVGATRAKPKRKRDRSALDRAEAALAAFEKEAAAKAAALDQAAKELERERAAFAAARDRDLTKLRRAVTSARRQFEGHG